MTEDEMAGLLIKEFYRFVRLKDLNIAQYSILHLSK